MNSIFGSLGSTLASRHATTRTDRTSQNRHRSNKEPLRPLPTAARPPSKTTGGADRARTDDLRLARAALSQLSYSPRSRRPERPALVGLGRFELPTSRLSGVRSNQLSYRPRLGETRRFPGN
jgi:hypothetical protein